MFVNRQNREPLAENTPICASHFFDGYVLSNLVSVGTTYGRWAVVFGVRPLKIVLTAVRCTATDVRGRNDDSLRSIAVWAFGHQGRSPLAAGLAARYPLKPTKRWS